MIVQVDSLSEANRVFTPRQPAEARVVVLDVADAPLTGQQISSSEG
jgi:hypothetical protein